VVIARCTEHLCQQGQLSRLTNTSKQAKVISHHATETQSGFAYGGVTALGHRTYLQSKIGPVAKPLVREMLKPVMPTPQKVHGSFENAFRKIRGLYGAFA